jgi:hypothetical protein
VDERDDRAWAAAAVERVVAAAREDALVEVRERLRGRMVDALMQAVEERRAAPPRAPGAEQDPPRNAPASAPAAPAPEPSGSALWVYGVTTGRAPEPGGWEGVHPGRPVRTIRASGLCALVSDVPLPEYGSEVLPQRLEEMERLESLARAHELVLDRALENAAVVPFRLCTIYASEESVRELLQESRDGLTDALERLEGTREWGLKAFLVAGTEVAAGSGEHAAGSGAEYLVRKREAREAAEQARERVWEVVEQVHAALSEQAAAAMIGRPQDRRLSGRDQEMVLNASYLVPDDRFEDFEAVVAELGEHHRPSGIELELTGPWPPYHFVDPEQAP